MSSIMENNIVSIVVNDNIILTNKNTTIIQACLKYNIDIPRFCFHEKLKIAGNCRMCLVEVVKSPKPVASCAMQVVPGMVIKTNTALVKKAREGVIEFLLVNHPLDCPICDQGGECDLQDQAMIFGGDKGRFYEFKRSVENKNCGPFIKMLMTRCIHCTRCIRFLTDVAGVTSLGLLGRGSQVEIGMYLDKFINTEVIGNVIDLCPVGALTSKPYAFNARSWELINIETVDIFDSLAADIRVDIRGTEILRILPRLNELVNSYWLTDVSRFCFDGLRIQRLTVPYIFENNKLVLISWDNVFTYINKYNYINKYILYKKLNYSYISGEFSDAKSLIMLKDLANLMGSSCYKSTILTDSFVNLDFKSNYLLTIHKENLLKYNLCVLVGINIRLESPLYNITLRKLYLKKKIHIISFSNTLNLTYYVSHIGLSINNFIKFLEGRHYVCNLISILMNKIYFILGSGVISRIDYFNFIKAINYFKLYSTNLICDFGILQTKLGRITGNELGLIPGVSYFNDKTYAVFNKANTSLIKAPLNYVFMLACDDYAFNNKTLGNNFFNIYLGYHGNTNVLKNIDIMLPILTVFEKAGLYINIENLLRQSNIVLSNVNTIKEDTRILLAFFYNFFNLNFFNNYSFDISFIYLTKYIIYSYISCFKQITLNLYNTSLIIVFKLIFNLLCFKFNKIVYFYSVLLFYNNNLNNFFTSFNLNYFVKYFLVKKLVSYNIFNLKNFDINLILRLKNISNIFDNNNLFSLNYIYFNTNFLLINKSITFSLNSLLYNYPFISYIDNYFVTTNISALSINMNAANQKFKVIFSNYI